MIIKRALLAFNSFNEKKFRLVYSSKNINLQKITNPLKNVISRTYLVQRIDLNIVNIK